MKMTEWEKDVAEEVLDEAVAVHGKVTFATISDVLCEWQRDDGVSDQVLLRTGVNAMMLGMDRGVLEYDEDPRWCDGCGRLADEGATTWGDELFCTPCVEDQRALDEQSLADEMNERWEDFVREMREEQGGEQ